MIIDQCFVFCLHSERAAEIINPPVYATSGHDYVTTLPYFNRSFYAMMLPPVPKDCPTLMGVAGRRWYCVGAVHSINRDMQSVN